jgi:hypothetical protein
MATPSAMSFHEDSRRLFRDAAMNKVQYNKQRWAHNIYDRVFQGFPKTSTGSWNVPFGGVMNDNGKPFNPIPGALAQGARLKGGIRNNENYAKVKQLLQQRARDMDFQDNPAVVPPMEVQSLTEEDKYKIKLNSLLLRLDDLVETGQISNISEDIWREIVILIANIAPVMTSAELNEMLDYWENIVSNSSMAILVKGQAEKQVSKPAFGRYVISADIYKFIKEMIVRESKPLKEKQLYARDWVRKSGFSGLATKILKQAREYADDWFDTIIRPELRPAEEDEGDDAIGIMEGEDNAEEGADEGADEEGEEEEEEEAVAPAPNAEYETAKRRFNYLFLRSPAGKGAASDELMELLLIVRPRIRTDKSRAQVKNDIYYLLNSAGAMGNALRERLAEQVPQIA